MSGNKEGFLEKRFNKKLRLGKTRLKGFASGPESRLGPCFENPFPGSEILFRKAAR
jgi:hypothetical protein